MAGVNKVIIVGNLGRDPEVKTMSNGNLVANLSIATSETWKDKATGERQERTEWHRVVIFNEGLVKVAEQYLTKGSTVYIEGQLQTRKYGPEGAEKYTTEIVLQKYRGELTMLGNQHQTVARMTLKAVAVTYRQNKVQAQQQLKILTMKSHFNVAMKNKVISALQNLTYEQLEAVNYFIVTLKKTGGNK